MLLYVLLGYDVQLYFAGCDSCSVTVPDFILVIQGLICTSW